MGDNIAPPRRDALAAAGGLEQHARENLDEEIVGELGERVPLKHMSFFLYELARPYEIRAHVVLV
jgi:hypothetical protein